MNNKVQISVILGTMCCLLTLGICVQIKTISNTTTAFGRTQTENELRDSVSRWQQKYNSAYAKLQEEENELEKLREDVSNNSGNSKELNNKLTEYNNLLGYTELVGPGLIITLNDGDPSSNKGLITDYIVHDGDVYQIVNALKNAGAEAIAVNGQRIVNTTSITCIGNVIKINGEKIGVPFEISAIGSPTRLYGSLTILGGYLKRLESDGVQVKVEKVEKNNINIPKYGGVYKFVYAHRTEK